MTPSDIPNLPGLGTTWYERGARYWLRRASGALLWSVLLAFFCYIALVLYGGFRTRLPPTVRTVWDWAQVALSFVALLWGWRVQRRDHHKKLLDPPSPTRPTRPNGTRPAAPPGRPSRAAPSGWSRHRSPRRWRRAASAGWPPRSRSASTRARSAPAEP